MKLIKGEVGKNTLKYQRQPFRQQLNLTTRTLHSEELVQTVRTKSLKKIKKNATNNAVY